MIRISKERATGDLTDSVPKRPRTGRYVTAALAVIGAVLWVVAPVGAFVALSFASDATQVAPPVAVWAPVEANTGAVKSDVRIGLNWGTAAPVVAPSWSGVVQRVLVGPGSTISDGTAVAVIDGITRSAWATDVPFIRLLSQGDTGSDVEQLNAFLSARTGVALTGSTFTRATRLANEAFALSIGVPKSNASTFDPAWVLFLPTPGILVDEASLTVGAPAPSPGTEVVKATSSLVSAVLLAGTESSTPSKEGEEPKSVLPTVTAGEDEELYLGSTKLSLNEARDGVEPSTLPELEQLVEAGATDVPAFLRSEAVEGEFAIPSTAVFSTDSAPSCVVARIGGKVRGVSVTVVADSLGVLVVTGALTTRDEVALAPEGSARKC